MKRIAPVLALAVILASTSPLAGQSQATEQTLKVAHESLMAAIKSGNLAMAQGLIHAKALGFYRASERAVELSSSYTAANALPTVLADLGRFGIVPFDATYRALGSTGIVLMSTNLQVTKEAKEKEKDIKSRYLRSTYVYVAVDGNWKLLSWHTSDTPLK